MAANRYTRENNTLIELHGIKTEPDGSETELVIRVHPPKKREEARHYYCDIEGDDFTDGTFPYRMAGDTSELARKSALGVAATRFERPDMRAADAETEALIANVAADETDGLDDEASARVHDTIVEIRGVRELDDGSSQDILVRIYPPESDESPSRFCKVDMEGLYETPLRLFGVDNAQAREISFMMVESLFDNFNIIRVED